MYGFYKIKTILKSMDNERIVSFNIDNNQNKLIILTCKEITKQSGMTKDQYQFKIYSNTKKDIIFSINLEDPQYIDILRQGHYSVLDGHIYTGNRIMKIRYDLIE